MPVDAPSQRDVTRPDQRYCLNCEQPLNNSRFCGNCGQDHRDARLSIRKLGGHFIEDFTELDTPIWRTLIGLSIRPGQVCREYVLGRRKRFTGPVKYFLICGALWVLVLSSFGTDATEGFKKLSTMLGGKITLQQMPASSEPAEQSAGQGRPTADSSEPQSADDENAASKRIAQFTRIVNEVAPRVPAYSNWVVLVTVPFMALLLSVLFYRQRLRVAEHAVLCLYGYAHSFLLSVPFALCGALASPIGSTIVALVPVAYLSWAAHGFYRVGWFSAIWKMLVSRLAQVFAAGILTLIVIMAIVLYRMLTE